MAEQPDRKRRAPSPALDGASDERKKPKVGKPGAEPNSSLIGRSLQSVKSWYRGSRRDAGVSQAPVIEPGDSGIFVTCARNKEAKSVAEIKDLFDDVCKAHTIDTMDDLTGSEFAERLYGRDIVGASSTEDAGVDVEAELNNEIKDMQKPTKQPLFTNVHINIQCVLFLKTRNPVEPVSFCQAICEDAVQTKAKRTRFVQRLTPMSIMGKATLAGLEEAATKALAPHFHDESKGPKKFAIRCNVRNHNTILKRDLVIKMVADTVGPKHKVDLTNFDTLILVEVHQNICGVSVVDRRYEELKRFNLAEIYEPSAADAGKEVSSVGSA
ncbi:MAG: hypothetical protein M1828_003803 [Chrysothrix sp. TS-e1954]|nr:MAG: hypothetical protein M1828_003803 [Chrysothrix sp. TS-e1954]